MVLINRALSKRFLTFPAILFERIFHEILPKLKAKWSARQNRPLRCLFSRREKMVSKGFLDGNCPTYNYWAFKLLSPMMTIGQEFQKKLSQ